MPTITIKFRTKRDEFAGGFGYKVPQAFKPNHFSYSSDLSSKFVPGDPRWNGAMVRRLLAKAGHKIPTIVWDEPTHLDTVSAEKANEELEHWSIAPVGNGFLVDVSRTYEI